jgi:hypothetical protein
MPRSIHDDAFSLKILNIITLLLIPPCLPIGRMRMEDLLIIKQSSLKRQDPPHPLPVPQGESRKDPTTGGKMRKMNFLESN